MSAPRKGDRVTTQPRQWHDGQPVENWPDAQFLGTVRSLGMIAGMPYARVKFDSGRTEWKRADLLQTVQS